MAVALRRRPSQIPQVGCGPTTEQYTSASAAGPRRAEVPRGGGRRALLSSVRAGSAIAAGAEGRLVVPRTIADVWVCGRWSRPRRLRLLLAAAALVQSLGPGDRPGM
jgi:hypothetical protein